MKVEWYKRVPGDGYTDEEVLLEFDNGAGVMLTRRQAVMLTRRLIRLLETNSPNPDASRD